MGSYEQTVAFEANFSVEFMAVSTASVIVASVMGVGRSIAVSM